MLRSHSRPTQQPITATWNSQGSTPAFPSAKPLDDFQRINRLQIQNLFRVDFIAASTTGVGEMWLAV